MRVELVVRVTDVDGVREATVATVRNVNALDDVVTRLAYRSGFTELVEALGPILGEVPGE